MTKPIAFVADAGKEAGLGHISRSSAVAVALACRGFETRCFAYGAEAPFERDRILWQELKIEDLDAMAADVLIADSYRLPLDKLAKVSSLLVIMHDHGAPPEGVALVVSATDSSGSAKGHLTGLAYAALRPGFWGIPRRALRDDARRVLVTTGSGHSADFGNDIAAALAERLRDTKISLVRGPHATRSSPAGVETIDGLDSLLEPLLASDLAVTAGGQTMLEAAAVGTPCIALPLVGNQRPQAERLAEVGAALVVDPPEVRDVVEVAVSLAGDPAARRSLSGAGQRAVDGFGALRVAFEIGELITKAP